MAPIKKYSLSIFVWRVGKKNQAVSEMSVHNVYSYSQYEDDNSTEIGSIIRNNMKNILCYISYILLVLVSKKQNIGYV